MILMIIIMSLIVVFGIYGVIKVKDMNDFFCPFTAIFSLIDLMCITIYLILLSSWFQLPERVDNMQLQVTQSIEDGASSYERKTIREQIFKINREVSDLQIDNDHWLWGIQTPDLVDDIKPVRMIER